MRLKLFILLFFSISSLSFAQTMVTGHVFEKNGNNEVPVIGANVYWAETTRGTSTNNDGIFSLPWPGEKARLVVSFVGYEPDTMLLSSPQQGLIIALNQTKELDEVRVSAREPGSHISRLNPITTIDITSAELCKAACCSLAESFETNASVDVSYTDAATGAKQIQLLGLSGLYVQMLTENMPDSRGLGSVYGLDFVPGPWMESIQVSKGAASVSNGYESLTGQINLQYKKPETSEKLFVNGFVNSSGRVESNVNSGINFGQTWATAVLAHASADSRKNDHNNDGFLDEPLTQRYIFMNRWSGDLSPDIFTQFGVKILDEERSGGQATFNRKKAYSEQEAYGIAIDTRNIGAFFKAGYIFPNDPEKSIAIVSNYSYHDQESLYGHRYYLGTQNYLAGNLIFASHFGNPQAHKYTTGVNYLYDKLEENLSGNLSGIFAPNGSRTEKVLGAYFQYSYIIPEKLTLLAGLRADNHNIFGSFYTPRIHLRYSPNERFVIRSSAGKGYRTPNALAENNSVLASSRQIFVSENIDMEEAWNYGLNVSSYIEIGLRELTINLEYYRTSFINQLVADMDQSAREVHFSMLEGKSYSNVFQAEASAEIFRGLDIVAAWRLNDVKLTTKNELRQKALQGRYRGLLNLSYSTPIPRWQVDFTAQFAGPGRVPDTSENPTTLQRDKRFEAFQVFNTQVTRYLRHWSFYAGIENIGDYTQANPIIAADSPFSEYFDSSMIWGPLMGRKIYFGFRFAIDRT